MSSRFSFFKERFPGSIEIISLLGITSICLFIVPALVALFFNFVFDFSMEDFVKVNSALDKITHISITKYSDPSEAAKYGHTLLPNYIVNTQHIKNSMWFIIVSSNIPLLVAGVLFLVFFRRNDDSIFLWKKNHYPSYLNAILAFFFALPFLAIVGQWNQGLHFPVEEVKNEMLIAEVKSGIIQQGFGDMNGIGELLLMILFVGVLTAIAEEFIFRVGLQKILLKIMPPHTAILIGAAVFSAVHFQFYGFFVRLILGLLLGYLYYWTKDIKTSIIAHAFNNGLAMVVAYNTGDINENPTEEMAGGFMITVILFTVLCGLSLYRIYIKSTEEENTMMN